MPIPSILSRILAAGLAAVAVALASTLFQAPVALAEDPAPSAEAIVVTKTVVSNVPVPHAVVKKPSVQLRQGTSRTLRPGKDGIRKVVYEVSLVDGKEVNRRAVSDRLVRKSVPEVLAVGSRGKLASRGYMSGGRSFRVSATGYGPRPTPRSKGRTAIGLQAGRGVVAVDPKFIPLGTRLYVDGYGHAVAGDTGGAIKGAKIDLGFDSNAEAIRFGRRKVTVRILD